jgi:hypothetical protein
MAKHKQKQSSEYIAPSMMRADKNFRMAKQTKRLLALTPFNSAEDRNSYRRAMIGAQLSMEAAARAPLKRERDENAH